MSGDTTNYLDRSSPTPLYIQLKNIIRTKISSEEWILDSPIPSENELCNIYGISRMTARSVITQLVSEGLLYRIPGKGTYVSESKLEITGLSYIGLRSQLEAQGKSVSTQLLSIVRVPCDEHISKELNSQPGEDIFKIKRIRYVDNSPVCYYKTFVPAVLCPDLDTKDLESEQLCKILSMNYALNRSKVVETLESHIADLPKAEILNIPPGFPLLLLQDKISTSSDVIFEYTRVYFRGDKIKLIFKYNE